jgi:hypothetical protein
VVILHCTTATNWHDLLNADEAVVWAHFRAGFLAHMFLNELNDTLSCSSTSTSSSASESFSSLSLSSSLQENGFKIIDNIFSMKVLNQLKDEIEFLHYSNWMEPSGNILQLSSASQETSAIKIKPNVYERSLVVKNELVAGMATMNLIPTLSQFWNERQLLIETLSKHTGLNLRALDQIKVAVIEENGSFMIHTDSTPVTYEFPGGGNGNSNGEGVVASRVMTMTLYLNQTKEDYCSDDGGFLRIYPLLNSTDPQIIDIAPIYGRAVLFSSTNLPHRVMPSKSTRYCISFFFYGTTFFPSNSLPLLFQSSILSNELLSLLQNQFSSASASGGSSTTTAAAAISVTEFEDLLSLIILQLRSRYSSICPLLFQSEYSRSIYEAFTTTATATDNSNEGLGEEAEDIHSAVKRFHSKCEDYRKTLDGNSLRLVEILTGYALTKKPIQVL